LEAHDRWLAWSASVLGRADGRLTWARWHRAAGDTEGARAAATEALALVASPSQPLVCLAAHRFMSEIETAAKRFEAADAHLAAALDLAAACEAPFERALTLLALAELRLAVGMTHEAEALLEEVRRICTPLGTAPTLARADALAARLPTTRPERTSFAGLTEREMDVLRLLPQDLTLEEIAARLFVSYSTVKTHLDHIRDKFGVSQRRDVVARAVQLGLLDPPRHPPFPKRVGDG
jgi:ATP/maltotriose-dependent transcriptional regulator MalT